MYFYNHARIYYKSTSLKGKVSEIDITTLRNLNANNKIKLRAIRSEILTVFSAALPHEAMKIAFIYQTCFEKMRLFYIDLINQAMLYLGASVGEIAFVYIGSYSRRQSTPFSDVESFTIIENEGDINYVLELTKLILLHVINLGETVFTSLGIKIFDYNGNEIKFNLYDTYTPDGFSFI